MLLNNVDVFDYNKCVEYFGNNDFKNFVDKIKYNDIGRILFVNDVDNEFVYVMLNNVCINKLYFDVLSDCWSIF